ncbi:hypothetical protein AT1G31270 [Arabidopsis thaliana]|uniref:Uncharacterized protein n=1 Tax=Arabidopsis thaliana TaxID=3702 RepID=F4I9B6_ARATH|nr:uncharacterized protein AT1G31270 [Arabidopsis thaliana]AEE31334.1 hypothetical protein AT1G31270 [Arabidopsis thaliana]|eukprot:NP_174412.1 hypothetical protein AT1G31270 [Arabidopsis thaliana]
MPAQLDTRGYAGPQDKEYPFCLSAKAMAEEPLRLNQSRLQDKLGGYCRGACRGEEPRRIQKETRLKSLALFKLSIVEREKLRNTEALNRE